MRADVAQLLERYVERRERDGERLAVAELCRGRPELAGELAEAVRRYDELEATLALPVRLAAKNAEGRAAEPLPSFAGFRTVERLGRGGMGEVFKLEDLRLGRTVAAKILRRDEAAWQRYGDFLKEARALALFQDPGIVSIYDYRADGDPPMILMEYVEGFELGKIGPSLDVRRRAQLMADVCEIVGRAHAKGIQHRDLKPGNVLVDAELRPKILDFGLSDGDPSSGHGAGTPGYAAPEQLDPELPIDERTDVYALGVVLYELLSGRLPYGDAAADEVASQIRRGRPLLPMEIDPAVPEPLQAIALKAMEPDPGRRYASAADLETDLARFLEGRPVRARPSLYAAALGERIRPHLDELREWLALKLVYPHEADRLFEGYRRLEAREDDWIVESRRLTLSQIALYLGAFLLLAGGLFYLTAHRVFEAVEGVLGPLTALGVPFVVLTGAARLLERRERKAAAVAYYLAGAAILPIFLVLFLHELAVWPVTGAAFFEGISNRELQVALALSCLWAFAMALYTRTLGLSTAFAVLAGALAFGVFTDLGLETWLEEGRWDLLALHLTPLLAAMAALALRMDSTRRAWLATPLYLGAAVLLVVILELLALNGRAFGYLGWSLDRFELAEVSDPELLETQLLETQLLETQLLETLAAMTLAGLALYAVAALIERFGTELARTASRLLFVLSPFAVLEPVFYLSATGEYARLFHWIYLALALAVTFASRYRQRKSFFFAGLFNTGAALYGIAGRYEWLELPGWSLGVIVSGLAALAAGVGLDHLERTRRAPAPDVRPPGTR